MKLNIYKAVDARVDEGAIQDAFERACAELSDEISDLGEAELNLKLTDNKEIKSLNKAYRGYDKPTDVLSFGYLDDDEQGAVGDIIISLERTEKQSKERGVSFMDEVLFLFIHGFLHVFGYDHDNAENRKRMFDLTDKIMGKKLPPYPEET